MYVCTCVQVRFNRAINLDRIIYKQDLNQDFKSYHKL